MCFLERPDEVLLTRSVLLFPALLPRLGQSVLLNDGYTIELEGGKAKVLLSLDGKAVNL